MVNRAGAEITGAGIRTAARRESRQSVSRLLAGGDGRAGNSAGLAQGNRVQKSDGRNAIPGAFDFAVAHCGRTRTTGFVYNFQDLTELKRLEREVVTKERMAALGRLSAAIAHEIRQPLTAMTGALKELGAPCAARRRRQETGPNRQPGIAAVESDHYRLFGLFSRENVRVRATATWWR